MAEARYLPFHYVDYLRNPGLPFSGGVVALRTYLCKTTSNGGNDSATSLYGKLRWMKDGGTGPRLNELVGGVLVDEALKGQGTPKTFVEIWNFMCRNKAQLKSLTVEVCGRRQKDEGYAKKVLKTGTVYDLYFDGRSDQAAIQKMVDDHFFGIDCIGFTSGVLILNKEWSSYKGATPLQWAKWHCTQKVSKATDIKPLDFLIWNGHIAMVDWVWKEIDSKTVEVDICQSSSGGPQCNERVVLQETSMNTAEGRRKFKIFNRGSPAMPVHDFCAIMRRKDFYW